MERGCFHVYILLLAVFQECKRKQGSPLVQPVGAFDPRSRGRACERN